MSVDVIPRFGSVEAELVGHNTNDWAVLVMMNLVVEGYAASQEGYYGGNGRDTP
jgi:hypothetical protein